MNKYLGPESKEWFLERVTCTRLWEQWTRNPADPTVRRALLESMEKLGLIRNAGAQLSVERR